MLSNQYSQGEKDDVIQLLLDGKTPVEVCEITGINKNTIIWWRTDHKKKYGIKFPRHNNHRGGAGQIQRTVEKTYFKYLDEEIITLVRLNPGFGMKRFVNAIYPRRRQFTNPQVRYRITMLLLDLKEETGEDLYDLLQDPSYNKDGAWKIKIDDQGGGDLRYVPLRYVPSTQEFNWGDIVQASKRPPRRTREDEADI